MNTKKKRTPNQKKKAIVSVLLMVAILITGAFAFLSATDSKTNVFTVGNVKIKLSEEFDTNQNGSIEKTNDENDEVYDASEAQVSLKGEILPGQKVIKRPYVENTGKNKAWVYITVGIPTTNSDNTFRNKDTGETSITGQNVDIPIQAYAIQENYANKTTYKDVWNAYFADKVTDTFGAEVTDAKTLSERVPLFEILNKTKFNEPIPDNISVDDNIPNDDWENIGITVDGQEKSYYKSANYDYYVFAYKALLDPTVDGAEQLNRTSDVFEGVRLLKDIGEAQPSKLSYYIKETAGNTLNGEVDLSVETSTYDGYRLVKTEYYMPGERVRNLYYDDTLAETGYSFNWNFMNDKTKSAYSGMTITQDTDLVATYKDTVSDDPKEPTEVPVVKYSPSGYLGYTIEQNDDGSYYATLIGADETRSDYPSDPTEVIVPSHIKVLENSDGTKLLEKGVVMHGSIDNFSGGTQIPVKKIQLAEWQWDSSTMNYAAPEAVALGKIAKKLNIAGSNIEEIKFCGNIYNHNITSGFVLEDIGTLPSSLTTLNNKAFDSCVNLKSCKFPNSLITIGDNAFDSCKSIENISISNGVTSIGNAAFSGCKSLTSITIPDSLTSIGDCAFYNCSGLTSITIPDSVTSIGWSAFEDCTGLTSIIMSNNVTNIEDCTFRGCSKLTSITIPDSVTSIGYSVFSGCSGLNSVTIGNGVTSIGDEAFNRCTGLTSITIPDSVTSIGSRTFEYCYDLVSIIIGNGVTSIGEGAFSGCTGLTSVTIGNGVTSIGGGAFCGCTSLTSVTIPDSVTSIGSGAFEDCISLNSINVADNNKNYASRDGILYTKDFSELLAYPAQNVTENLVLPEGLKKISDSAFENNNYIKSITIPSTVTKIGTTIINKGCIEQIVIDSANTVYDSRNNCNAIIETATNTLIEGCKNTVIPNSVTSIGNSAFYQCFSLASITIPDSVTSIGSSAFEYCYDLVNIIIGNGVTSIGDSAFHSCSRLTSITIGNGVTNIGDDAFGGCPINNITVDSNNKTYDSRNNCNAIIKKSTNTLILGCKNSVIPDSVTSIGDSAFYWCQNLTSITIPDSVTSIGDSAFEWCTGLTSITIPDSVKSIGNHAFEYCSDLVSIIIGNGVTSIGHSAFFQCSSLTSVTIPGSVTSIGDSAFTGCTGLTSVTIPDSVTSIGCDAFSNCTGLTSITIPDNATSIGISVFSGCTGLTSITIPGSVTSIGDYAFKNCKGLTSITIPNNVTSIGYSAFESCDNLKNIIYQGTVSDWAKVDCPPNSFASGLTITCTDGTVTTQ